MTTKDPPFDPFGRSERTIIRPNPAGRRVQPPPPSAPAQAPRSEPGPIVDSAAGAFASGDEWAAPPAAPPPVAAGPVRQKALLLKREQLLTPSDNPLMRSAAPLLLLLGSLRVTALRASFGDLMEQVADSITQFEREIRAAGVPAEEARVAKYLLSATADDIVQNIPSEDRHVWTQHSMLSRFFGERVGGVRFFEELDRAKADPTRNYALLELIHACLALGFQGIHRTSAGGAATLQMIQRNLYETMRRVKKPDPELSPRWRGQTLAPRHSRFAVPVWAVASLVGVALFAVYLILRTLLGGDSEAVAASLLAVHPNTEIGIQRRVFAAPAPRPPPAPPSGQAERIRTAIGPPVTIHETPNAIVVRLANLALFASGQASVRNEFKPLMTKIAGVLEREPGTIRVVGHTDSIPIRTVRFPSNFELSRDRAESVAGLLRKGLTQPGRITVEGKGADDPIASNATPAGRAQNRRVDILVQRSP